VRRLAADLPAFTVDAWIHPLVADVEEAGLRITCPSTFHRERLRDRFLGQINACASAEAGGPVAVELLVADSAPSPEPARADRNGVLAPPARMQSVPADRRQHPGPRPQRPVQRAFSYTFDSFVVGPCNALAREASYAIAHGNQANLNLLYLKSETGLGKTHLARAIVRESDAGRARRARYASAETFTNEFMQAIRGKQMEDFKRRYRRDCDLLVLEDVPFLESKTATQLELFHTLTHLLDVGACVVITGSCLPRAIPGIDARLASQMTAGLVAELEFPDARVRRRILRSKAASGGVGLPDDCLDLLVERARGNVRELEGVLIQLVSTASLLKRSIDIALTEAALRKLDDNRPVARRLAARAVIEAVATFFQTTPEALASRSRRRDVLVPRQLAMYLCRRFTDAPVAEIAGHFGRNHTAVTNAERVVSRAMLERAPLRYQDEALCERLDQLEQSSTGPHR